MNTTAVNTKEKSVEHFLERLKCACRRGAKATFEKAAILDEALNTLCDKDLSRLAELAKLSRATISKYQTIHEKWSRFAPYLDNLGDGWTLIYQLCLLSDGQFRLFVEQGRLRRDLTAKQILDWLRGNGESAVAGGESVAADADSTSDVGSTAVSTNLTLDPGSASVILDAKLPGRTQAIPISGEQKSRLIATIRAYGDVDDRELKVSIQEALQSVLKGKPLRLEFPERKSAIKEKCRKELATNLRETLKQKLASYQEARAC